MVWQTFQHSKAQVDAAARQLVANDLTTDERIAAIKTVANFRAAHAYPMQSMVVGLMTKAKQLDKRAITVRRLKRIPSIVAKLGRQPKMRASAMGDIGGIRIIVKDMRTAQALAHTIKKTRTNNKLVYERDYITNPKASGYRSIHLTYAYRGTKTDYHGLRVEVQIRSTVQHSWATAVEVAALFTKQNLKASMGDEQWLDFFQAVSMAFNLFEHNKTIDTQLKKSVNMYATELHAIDMFQAFTVSVRVADKQEGYYLLDIDVDNKTLSVQYFTDTMLETASDSYRRLEQEIADNPSRDAVLVSATSLHDLKRAYPNYFVDTSLFVKLLGDIIA